MKVKQKMVLFIVAGVLGILDVILRFVIRKMSVQIFQSTGDIAEMGFAHLQLTAFQAVVETLFFILAALSIVLWFLPSKKSEG